jgi:hypothetical protein
MTRAMIPHGDRRDGAESGRIEGEITLLGPLNDDIVSVFVLGQDIGHRPRRILRSQAVEDIAKRALILELTLKGSDLARRYGAGITDRNFSQE